jgi:hypothetical protein
VGLRLISLIVISMIAGCNPPADYALVGSAYVPAAHGQVDVEKIDKEQMHYIVWFTPVGERPVRQRALDYDPDAQVGRASIPTSLREFEVQITAENSETPNQPSDLLVASQKIREI